MNRVHFTLALALVAGAACAEPPERERVLLIGVDGLEWDVCLPLLREGRMPALAELMQRGTYGELETFVPTQSPVIWTTIATGKLREEHGILGFSKPVRRKRPRELFSNRDRRTKAVWNVATDYGRRVAVVGWWMTSPVEPVNGIMVAQTNTVEQLAVARGKHVWKGGLVPGESGQVYPPEREEGILAVLGGIEDDLDERLTAIFGEFEHPLSLLEERLWDNCRWAFRADATYARIAEDLLREERFDFTAVYFGGPDVVGHRFWRYRDPEVYAHRPDPAQVENFGSVIDDYYAYVDEVIGRLVDAAGPEADVLVVSDHGMGPINQGARFDPDDPPVDVNSAHHYEAPPGVIVAAGPGFAASELQKDPRELTRSELPRLASVLDVTRTVLRLLDLPPGEDMHGEVPAGLVASRFLARPGPPPVATHDTEAWIAAHAALARSSLEEAERVRQLSELGYIDGGDEDAEDAPEGDDAEEPPPR